VLSVLWSSATPSSQFHLAETQAAAQTLGVKVVAIEVRRAEDFERAFQAAKQEGAQAVIVLPAALFNANRVQLARYAAATGLPTMYPIRIRDYVVSGGLMAYGENLPDLWRRSATFVDKILRRANPAELPVELPTSFDVASNARALNALGLTLPPLVAAQVTEWID
jgi:putative ABC transport system substrate-binding protein